MLVWVQRHKKKVLFLAVVAAGGYFGGRYLLRKAAELQERKHSERHEELRLREHFESNRQTCLSAALSLTPTLRETVLGELDAEALTAQLRTKPANKITLWEQLKIVSFTRTVVGVYASTLLTVFLRVQLSVLGGCMFLDLQRTQESAGTGAYSQEAQKQYLSIVQYLLQEGLVGLARGVREAAEAILVSYPLKHELTCEGVLQILSDIRQQASAASQSPRSPRGRERGDRSYLVQYLLPKEPLLQAEAQETKMDRLLAATRDIVESVEFSHVLEGTVDRAFSQLQHSLVESYHSAAQSSPTLPLARVIPLLTDLSQLLLSTQGPKNLFKELMATGDLQRLSENIYEAFSHSM